MGAQQYRPDSERGPRRQRGVALVLVLWVVMLMTIIAGSFSLTLKREIDLVRNAKEQAQAGALADAGIQLAMMMLSASNSNARWRGDGTVYEVPLQDARIRVQLFDEAGKFDINSVSEDTLQLLLENNGLDEDAAQLMMGAIVDWRDNDDETHAYGAEEQEYADSGYTYGPRNKSFQSLQELQLVMGMTGELYARLEPVITIYTRAAGIDPAMASRQVLLSLPDVDAEVVDRYLEARMESMLNDEPSPPFPVNIRGSSGAGATYQLRAEALLPGGARATRQVIIGRGAGRSGLPFSYLAWEQPPAGQDSLFSDSVVAYPGFVLDWKQPQGDTQGTGAASSSGGQLFRR